MPPWQPPSPWRKSIGPGAFTFATSVGEIVLETTESTQGMMASFTTVEPAVSELSTEVLDGLLALLGLAAAALDPRYPAQQSFTGNTHPILTVRTKADLDGFNFDAPGLRTLMDEQGWAGTVTVMWIAGTTSSGTVEIESRNLFPVGDITEDPATGSAAASTGAYLRAIGAVTPPASLVIRQGRHVGRPCILHVTVPAAGGITVTGTATRVR
ncbi:PhzF family phenazine biosynthesis protein [Arthrobacter psychrolactophilus]